jgi:hypothetical protein
LRPKFEKRRFYPFIPKKAKRLPSKLIFFQIAVKKMNPPAASSEEFFPRPPTGGLISNMYGHGNLLVAIGNVNFGFRY